MSWIDSQSYTDTELKPTFNCICIYAFLHLVQNISFPLFSLIDTVQFRLDCHIRLSCWFIHVNRFRCGSQPWSCEPDDRGGSAWRRVSQEQESVSTLYTTLELDDTSFTVQSKWDFVAVLSLMHVHTTETTTAHSEYGGVHSFEASSTYTDNEILGLQTLGFLHFRNLPKPK